MAHVPQAAPHSGPSMQHATLVGSSNDARSPMQQMVSGWTGSDLLLLLQLL